MVKVIDAIAKAVAVPVFPISSSLKGEQIIYNIVPLTDDGIKQSNRLELNIIGKTIGLPPLREKGPPADSAQAGGRGRAVLADGSCQHRVKGQNGLPEVAAVGPRPPLAQHIALTVQRQTAIVPVIVGAHLRDQFADTFSLVTGQLPAHQDFGPTWAC